MENPSTNPPNQHFAPSQLAAALGKTKRAILNALRNSPASGIAEIKGQRTRGWSVTALPPAMRDEVQTVARTRGFRDAGALLTAPLQAWPPPIPLAECSPRAIDKAALLQRALLPALERQHDLSLPEAEFEQFGAECYRREVGHAISARHWRRLFQRTVERDGGAEDWTRLEIYLDENAGRRGSAIAPMHAASPEHAELAQLIAAFKNPATPTTGEMDCLWDCVFQRLEGDVASGRAEPRARRALFSFLNARASFLAENREALRVQFNRKLARWRSNGRIPSAIADGRRERSGWHRAPELSQEDRDALAARATLDTGGRVNQAWKEALRAGDLSEDLTGYYTNGSQHRPAVPRRVRDAIKHDVAMMEDIHHGPRQAKLNGPHLERDWAKVAAGDWHQADDVTFPIYYYEPDGKGWFTLWRGQCLVMIDARTTRILAFALLSSRSYNAPAIRTLITRTCDEHGLPRRGFYFERGIWQSSKLLKGECNAPISLPEAEKGLQDLGLKFIHSNLPRSKPVERVIGAMQNLMEGLPGYVGRDERHDRFERVQKLKRDVENRKLHPQGHFYSAEEWLVCLEELCARYNAEAQGGKMLPEMSPDDGYSAFQRKDDPPIRFDASCRYLLAHHRRVARVTGNGITLHFGRNKYVYRNATTGRLIGREVLAWWNPETPDVLAVTDMNREQPFLVERAQPLPAMDAPDEMIGKEMRRANAHMQHAHTYYRTLKAKHAPEFRRNFVDAETAELGNSIREQHAEHEQRTKSGKRTAASATKAAASIGAVLRPQDARRPEVAESMQALSRLLSEPDETETEQPQ